MDGGGDARAQLAREPMPKVEVDDQWLHVRLRRPIDEMSCK